MPTISLHRSILIATLGAACPAVHAGVPLISEHHWWFPGGSPVSGGFATSANWVDFDLPITDGSRVNNLYMSDFASPADFVAENDIQAGLPVGRMFIGDTGTTTRITGLPIRPQRFAVFGVVNNPRFFISGDVTIETPLQGTDPLRLSMAFATLQLDPNGSGPHNFSGGLIQFGGVLKADRGSAFGSFSNWYEMQGGATLRATNSFTLGIPVVIPESGGITDGRFDTPNGVQLTLSGALTGGGDAEKIGPGTLIAIGDGSGEDIDWRLEEGRIDVSGTGLGDLSRVRTREGTILRLIGDTTLGNFSPLFEKYSPILLNGHTLTVNQTSNKMNALTGPGAFRILPGASVNFLPFPGSIDSGYTLHAEGVATLRDGGTYDGVPFAAMVIGPNGSVTGYLDQPQPIGTGTLAGSGLLSTSSFRFGGDDSSGAFAGVLENTDLCRKQGSGSYTLSGVNAISGRVVIEGGELIFPTPQSLGTPTEIEIYPGAQLSLPGGSSVSRVIADGTLRIITSVLTLDESGTDSSLSGALLGSANATLRKRGTGTLTIDGDTSGFQGFFDVLGGTCVFNAVSLVPNGRVFANGDATLRGHGEIASSLLVQNLLTVSPGQTLRLTAVNKQNFGLFEAPASSVLEMDNVSIMQDGNGVFGTVRADAGTVRLGAGTEITDGTIEAVNGGVIELAGQAVVRSAMIVGSITRLAGGGLELDNSALTLASGDTLSVLLDQDDAGATAVITGVGSADLAGTLDLEFADGFAPATGARFSILGGASPANIVVSGAFDTVITEDLGANVLRLNETSAGVEAVVTCPADIAQPYGVLDLSDISGFISGFLSGDLSVDFDENGILDLGDIGLFIAVIVDGCP